MRNIRKLLNLLSSISFKLLFLGWVSRFYSSSMYQNNRGSDKLYKIRQKWTKTTEANYLNFDLNTWGCDVQKSRQRHSLFRNSKYPQIWRKPSPTAKFNKKKIKIKIQKLSASSTHRSKNDASMLRGHQDLSRGAAKIFKRVTDICFPTVQRNVRSP